MKTDIKIGSRHIGDNHPCFITLEAGPTHNGFESACELVNIAAASGADAVKFQIVDPDRLCNDRKQLFSYSVLVDRETGQQEEISEPLYDILCRRSLSESEWLGVKKQADKSGIAFFATAAFPDEIDLLERMNCDSIKIASADVTHFPLIKKAAATGQVIQLDTGSSTLGEIEKAVDVILSQGNERIVIHQCPSGYPAKLDSINLNLITTMKKMFPFPIAYSDHTPGWEMDVAALALGANLLEKSITKDRTTRSVEHIFSLEPSDIDEFISVIRDVERAFGSHRRLMSDEELQKRLAVRRSCYFNTVHKAGDAITDNSFIFQRPGFGVSPEFAEQLIGRKLIVDVEAGQAFDWSQIDAKGA